MTEPTQIPPPAMSPPAMSQSVLEALWRADRPTTGPQPGELWRARDADGHTASVVLVRTVDGSDVRGVTVTFDVEVAGDHTWVVDADRSPLGVALAVHESWLVSVDRDRLVDRLGSIDGGGRPPSAVVVPPIDEAALDEWWPLEQPPTTAAELILALSGELGDTRPGARVVPRPGAVALVAEMDAFILVRMGEASLTVAQEALRTDQLLNAVCMVEPAAPFMAVVIDRRDVVDAIETPSGELRPPRHSREPMPVGQALVKFLDQAISPFGRLAGTVVDGQAIDARELAVDVASEAVRVVEASARGFKVEGKRPGYEQVTRHKMSIIRLVEAALAEPEIDVAAILEHDE